MSEATDTTGTSASASNGALLEFRDVDVRFPTPRGVVHAVNRLSLTVHHRERVAVVGESGCGKSVTALALLGLVPAPGIVTGSVRFRGEELTGLSERRLARIRGAKIGLIFQDAAAALDPLMTIGHQIEEPLRIRGVTRAVARAEARRLISRAGIGDPDVRYRQYAHELSGGMAQRAVIASAVAPRPELLVADEPTSALDATTASGVLELLAELGDEREMAVILISHDLGLVARFADRAVVMYAGRVVEDAPIDELFAHARHPYTRGLLESVPGARGRRTVKAIPGSIANLASLPPGCAFHPRCFLARDRCRTDVPTLMPVPRATASHVSACHFATELEPLVRPQRIQEAVEQQSRRERDEDSDLLAVDSLTKEFEVKSRLFHRGGVVQAVDGVSFTVRRGEVFALVGESGSGKSTTGRLVLGLETPSSGSVVFNGEYVAAVSSRGRSLQRKIQAVFQNPNSSLNPRLRIGSAIAEPLEVHGVGTARERRERVFEVLEHVALSPGDVDRYPFEFSGGQRQRIAIARALALKPDLVVCDEPVASLDVSVQAQILNLLQDIQRDDGLSYLFIAHDLAVVRQIATRVAVMYLGQIIELADTDNFFAQPHHPYSVALLSAMSSLDPEAERRRDRIVLTGAVPSPFDPPPACRFHTRCWKAEHVCRTVAPPLEEISPGRWVACHMPEGVGGHALHARVTVTHDPLDRPGPAAAAIN